MAHNWLGTDAEGRRIATMLFNHGIETLEETRSWLGSGRPIRGIGPKSRLIIEVRLKKFEQPSASQG